jgi:alkylresorcinol/alkylpyrone synthase
MPAIVSVGTSVPEFAIDQEEARQLARRLFIPSLEQAERLLSVFDHAAIERRYLSRPAQWFLEEHTWAEKNQVYIETACRLGKEAIQRCLAKVNLSPDQIDHLIFVSTTGLATPSLDAHLINQLQMNPHVKRTPIWGLGCAGGVVGLARAYEAAKATATSRVLLLTVECCGLTFHQQDHSKRNLVATSLFADGAAAALIVGDEVSWPKPMMGPQITNSMSTLIPDTLEIMGWNVVEDGWEVVFSKRIPQLVKSHVKPALHRFLASQGLTKDKVDHYITHPGGRKVLEAYQEAFALPFSTFAHSYAILREYGNMSSVTVLFVLAREMEESHRFGSYGLVSALGPGFCAEFVLLQWGTDAKPSDQHKGSDSL